MSKENQDLTSAQIMAKILLADDNLKEAIKKKDADQVNEITIRKRELLKQLKEAMDKKDS